WVVAGVVCSSRHGGARCGYTTVGTEVVWGTHLPTHHLGLGHSTSLMLITLRVTAAVRPGRSTACSACTARVTMLMLVADTALAPCVAVATSAPNCADAVPLVVRTPVATAVSAPNAARA